MDNPDVIMFGLMSSMRTGNMILDMAVCLLLPFIFKQLWGHLQLLVTRIGNRIRESTDRDYRRTIEHTRSTRPWSAQTASHKNKVLIKAIRTYIGREVKPIYPSGAIRLQTVQSNDGAEAGGLTKVQVLQQRFHLVCVPPRGERVEVAPGLFFMDTESVTKEENGEKKATSVSMTTCLIFTTNINGGKERVDAFINKAYRWFVDQVESTEDHSFFMYQPLVSSRSIQDDAPKGTKFKRYKLSGEKTFKSIFFPEREKVLRILKHFAEKSGKYAIKGFPHKLGLLLHGPPGTGKTSLVKAIAQHTKRHIISVPLSRIRTNQELMDVMFDQVFKYDVPKQGEDNSENKSKHLISEVVFLLEDVDAASKVVHTREGAQPTTLVSPSAKGKKGGDGDDESTMMRQLSHALVRQATILAESATGVFDPDAPEKDGKENTKEGEGEKKDEGEAKKDDADPTSAKKSLLDDADKLDLAGLLNVLDGVVDAPGRILIMTTNHPEKLDPALLRPGRVNLQIYMGFICCDDAVRMTSHYYPAASAADAELVRAAFMKKDRACINGLKLSPAEYEQLCAESETITQLVDCLTKLVPKR